MKERVSRHWHRRFLFAHSRLYRWWELESRLARRWRYRRWRKSNERLIASLQRLSASCKQATARLRGEDG